MSKYTYIYISLFSSETQFANLSSEVFGDHSQLDSESVWDADGARLQHQRRRRCPAGAGSADRWGGGRAVKQENMRTTATRCPSSSDHIPLVRLSSDRRQVRPLPGSRRFACRRSSPSLWPISWSHTAAVSFPRWDLWWSASKPFRLLYPRLSTRSKVWIPVLEIKVDWLRLDFTYKTCPVCLSLSQCSMRWKRTVLSSAGRETASSITQLVWCSTRSAWRYEFFLVFFKEHNHGIDYTIDNPVTFAHWVSLTL